MKVYAYMVTSIHPELPPTSKVDDWIKNRTNTITKGVKATENLGPLGKQVAEVEQEEEPMRRTEGRKKEVSVSDHVEEEPANQTSRRCH